MRIFVIIILFISANLNAQNSFRLPLPEGLQRVGTTHFYITDRSRPDKTPGSPTDYRTVYVRAWYPADVTTEPALKYLEGYNIDTIAYKWAGFGIPKQLFSFAENTFTNSYINAPVDDVLDTYPLLIFSHGYGVAVPEMYTVLMEHLASNGYIVFSMAHPYEALQIVYPNGSIYLSDRSAKFFEEVGDYWNSLNSNLPDAEREKMTAEVLANSKTAYESLNQWVKDAQAVLDAVNTGKELPVMFKNKIDVNRIGAMGHSFGGAMAGELAATDPRIKAAMNIDGFQYGSLMDDVLEVPFVVVNTRESEMYNKPILDTTKSILYYITIPDTKHFGFSDIPAYPDVFDKPQYIGSIDPFRFISIQNNIANRFFDKHLRSGDKFGDNFFNDYEEIEVKILGR